MKRNFVILGIMLAFLVMATGCWNRRELNDLAIAVAMGIDKAGDQYRVTVQVVDPGEVAARKASGGRTPVTIYQAKGATILEALRRTTTISPREIYAAHLRVLMIGEPLAREGIGKTLDLLSRDHEIRTDFYIAVAKGTTAENVLKIMTPLEKIPANKLYSSLETSEKKWAPTMGVTLDELISYLVSDGKHPLLTGLELIGSTDMGQSRENVEQIDFPTRIRYAGLGVFKKDKLIGWLNEKESIGVNYILDNVNNTVGHIPCPKGGNITLELIRTETVVKGSMKNGKPQIDIEIRSEGNVGEVQCQMDLSKSQNIYDLEIKAEQTNKDIVEAAISKAQKKFKVDIFGFGEAIHRAAPESWKQLKDHWDEDFVNVPVTIKTDFKIRRVGTVGNSFLEEMKE